MYKGEHVTDKKIIADDSKSIDREQTIERGANAIYQRIEAYKDHLVDNGITDADEIERIAQKFKEKLEVEFATDLLGQEVNIDESETADLTENEKCLFGFTKKEIIETDSEIRQRLQECGVNNVQLEGVKERYQELIADSVEKMCESYPELKGYIGAVRATNLPEGVFACAGPVMTKEGYNTEIQVNREIFSKNGLESRIERLEIPNWRGESWLAGEGAEAVIKHEIGHILHLRMIAEQEGLEIGSTNRADLARVQDLYNKNSIAVSMCYETMKEQNINPNDLARNISVYGAHDMGECFAEAISEYETRRHPRAYAVAVHEKYERRVRKYDDYTT
jgi:hypothetical protein